VVDADGVIRGVAGSGGQGFSADGTSALAGPLSDVENIVVTGGDLFFTEAGSGRLRTIDVEGRLRTVAGAGSTGGTDGR
jgi:hypothetical protein